MGLFAHRLPLRFWAFCLITLAGGGNGFIGGHTPTFDVLPSQGHMRAEHQHVVRKQVEGGVTVRVRWSSYPQTTQLFAQVTLSYSGMVSIVFTWNFKFYIAFYIFIITSKSFYIVRHTRKS